MHGDKLSVGGPRSVPVEPFDDAGFDTVPAVNDEPWLAGTVLVQARARAARRDPQRQPARVREQAHRPAGQRPAGLGDVGRRDQNDGQPRHRPSTRSRSSAAAPRTTPPSSRTTVYEEGWLDRTGDERCTRTTYAANEATWLLANPASVTSARRRLHVHPRCCRSPRPTTTAPRRSARHRPRATRPGSGHAWTPRDGRPRRR